MAIGFTSSEETPRAKTAHSEFRFESSDLKPLAVMRRLRAFCVPVVNGAMPFLVAKRALILLFTLLAFFNAAASINAAVIVRASTDSLAAQSDYEGRPIAGVEVVLEGSARDASAEAEFLSLLRVAPNTEYSAVRVRESLQALLDSGRVAFARVEATSAGAAANSPVRLRFVVRRQVLVGEVSLDLKATPATTTTTTTATVSEDELRGRLDMLQPGMRFSEQSLRRTADNIQTYLRDRGFFKATVTYTQQPDPSGTRANVTFRIEPGAQSSVAAFGINVAGFDAGKIRPALALQTNAAFSRGALGEDINRIRQAVIAEGYLAPQLADPKVTYDSASNTVTVNLTGAVGPKVEVAVKNYELNKKTARELLPVEREGSVDQSAIVEGARRLRNRLQENGFFFAEVTPVCTVTPPTPTTDPNGTEETCLSLNPSELSGRTVNISYDVNRGRRFKLTDIRLEGTNKLSLDDVPLRTQKATALGFIPYLGYGRGYTSPELLDEDRRTIEARMRDLGYRRAKVEPRQGVSINGENLIITFAVTEGLLTRVAGVEIRGNQIYTEKRLRDELTAATCRPLGDETPSLNAPTIIGGAFSLSQARADGDCIRNLYARNGYVDLNLDLSTVELPKKGGDEQVRLVYTISKEGEKTFIGRIIVNGNVMTEKDAILKAIPLKEEAVLRADKIADTERTLYSTDAFRQAIVRTEPAGETAGGFAKRDVIIDVEEQKPRVLSYGGGYSTDNGPQGFVDLRNVNLFGKLRQGAARIRGSNRQQLVGIDYFDPRFRRYGENQIAPLTLSAQYQRDTSVTRFFRSTIDQGAQGIVQRLDAKGNPIDIFGNRTKQPTINRFTLSAQTQRDLQLTLGPRGEERTRTTIFLRYDYQDVRLFNIGSLLLAPILQPDRAVRLSRFGTTFVRDTRDNKLGDATRGDFLTFDYGLALRQLGGNISFNRLETSYRRFYRVDRFRRTVLAGNVSLGLANLFNPRDRNGNNVIDEVDKTLPISERFFSGGSTTLRGFAFQEAGPRIVIPCGVTRRDASGQITVPDPCGQLRDRKGKIVSVSPFTVPVGGNALAIVNLEARVPVTKSISVVPFYDGGNVFRRASDLFGRKPQPGEDPNLRALFTHTVGLGFRIKTPIGGALAVDYGFLLNPPQFVIPQQDAPDAILRLKNSQLHFRFSQAF